MLKICYIEMHIDEYNYAELGIVTWDSIKQFVLVCFIFCHVENTCAFN